MYYIWSVPAPQPESGSLITLPHLFHTQQVHRDWKNMEKLGQKIPNQIRFSGCVRIYFNTLHNLNICQYFYRSKVSVNLNLNRCHTVGDCKSVTRFFARKTPEGLKPDMTSYSEKKLCWNSIDECEVCCSENRAGHSCVCSDYSPHSPLRRDLIALRCVLLSPQHY